MQFTAIDRRRLRLLSPVSRAPRVAGIEWASRTLPSAQSFGLAAAAMMALFAVELMVILTGGTFLTPDKDRFWYMDAARQFLATGTPYGGSQVMFLHPPLALYLFVPFTFLPAALWYVLPITVVGWFLWATRPSPIGWLLVAMCLAWPRTPSMLANGNTDLWVAAFVALGLRFGGPAILVLVKPTLAPFALVGIHRRSWWLALAVLALAGVPFGMLWFDWVEVVRNAPGDGPLYSLYSVPLVLLPLAATAGSRRATG